MVLSKISDFVNTIEDDFPWVQLLVRTLGWSLGPSLSSFVSFSLKGHLGNDVLHTTYDLMRILAARGPKMLVGVTRFGLTDT